MVAYLKSPITARDYRLAFLGHRPEQEAPVGFKARTDLGQGAPGKSGALTDLAAEDDEVATRHLVHLISTSGSLEFHDLIRGVGIRVNDDVGAHGCAQRGPGFAAKFFGLDADYGLRHARLFCQQRGDQVDLIVLRDSNKEIGAIDSRCLQC